MGLAGAPGTHLESHSLLIRGGLQGGGLLADTQPRDAAEAACRQHHDENVRAGHFCPACYHLATLGNSRRGPGRFISRVQNTEYRHWNGGSYERTALTTVGKGTHSSTQRQHDERGLGRRPSPTLSTRLTAQAVGGPMRPYSRTYLCASEAPRGTPPQAREESTRRLPLFLFCCDLGCCKCVLCCVKWSQPQAELNAPDGRQWRGVSCQIVNYSGRVEERIGRCVFTMWCSRGYAQHYMCSCYRRGRHYTL